MEITSDEIKNALSSNGYCATNRIETAVWASVMCEKPMLLEGAPGVGKTSLAKALADGLGLPFIRVQMYEGLTDDRILYDYDYQKQLLTLEAIKPKLEEEYKDLNLADSIKAVSSSLDFYGTDFLIKRPVLRSITSDTRCVLLFDEIDKAPEEIEYMLYEFLENYSITIPQYGEISCDFDKRPIVFITSNGYRDLSGALRRRCTYLYIDKKSTEEIYEILKVRSSVSDDVARGIAVCLAKIGDKVKTAPSISEAIDFADFVTKASENDVGITRDIVMNALGLLIKNPKDMSTAKRIVDENGAVIWSR